MDGRGACPVVRIGMADAGRPHAHEHVGRADRRDRYLPLLQGRADADEPHSPHADWASEPMGSHAGSTMGGWARAARNSGDRSRLRAAISNMCWSNHESFIT